MDAIKRMLADIREQLGRLNTSQRLAIGLCAVVVAGSLLWLVQFSTSPELVAVLAQDMTLQEVDDAITALKNEGVSARQRGNRVYVRPQERTNALMILSRAELLPKDTSVGFAELMTDSDPFRPSEESEWRRRVALGNELARVIATAPDVKMARVIIQDKSRRRIGAMSNIRPTASVYLTMNSGQPLTQDAVEALCRFVAGAVPGLEPTDVVVVDALTMQPRRIPNPEEALGLGQLDERKKNEQHLTGKLLEALQSIPGVLVTVSCQLDASRTNTQRHTWAKPAVKLEETISSTATSESAPAETGVNPNVGVALSGASGGGGTETEEGRTEFYPQNPEEVTQVQKPPFSLQRATASIGIPRSFLAGVFQARFGAIAEQDNLDEDARYVQLRTAEIERVRNAAMNILMTREAADVDVDVFYDLAEDGGKLRELPGVDVQIAASGGTMTDLARRYGVQVGLGTLSLLSFLIMARLVRGSSTPGGVRKAPESSPRDQESEEILRVPGGPVGKAAISDSVLIGREIDDETLRLNQLGEQVSKMIQDDPKSAVEMIKHWVETSD